MINTGVLICKETIDPNEPVLLHSDENIAEFFFFFSAIWRMFMNIEGLGMFYYL